MAVLPIIKYGNSILRLESERINVIDNEIKQLARDMIETMQASEGIGLAAPQVARSLALITIDLSLIDENEKPAAFINPKILEKEGEIVMEEGCLSVPGIKEEVTRPERIRIVYQTVNSETVDTWVDGLLARVLQHEVDHLYGVLFVDRINIFRKKMLTKQLKQIAKEEKESQKAAA